MIGKIHSIETFGTVDGPGVRYVIFLQGCNFRCAYCHNPDTWNLEGKGYSVDELIEDISKYRRYIEGVTITGGEPLMQVDFVIELFEKVRNLGLNTCIDTNGSLDLIGIEKLDKLIEVCDLFMLDIKHISDDKHINLTGKSNKNVLDFAKYLSEKNIDTWLRYVLVPDINDDDETLIKWRQFADSLNNVKKIELLPYHRLAIDKYKKLGIEYKLKDTLEPTREMITKAKKLLKIEEN